MSAITTGVTIIGGRNDGSICGLNLDTPTPLVIPTGQALTFTHNTGKRAYKINMTNLSAVDPISNLAYTAYNMNQVEQCGAAQNPVYETAVFQKESGPNVYNDIVFDNPSLADVAVCIQIFWEVNSEELNIVTASGNSNPSTDKNDPRITFVNL
jgi:hypothetical protein